MAPNLEPNLNFILVSDWGGYKDYEAPLLTLPGLYIDIRLTVPDLRDPSVGIDEVPQIYLLIGDEADAFAHNRDYPEPAFPVSFDVARKLIGLAWV
jgi:hypothetical protein